ncbi:VIT domain-containing protein [Piscinibacter sp.]|jgi:Ca-activated chloride channel family protein|uniref:VIT and vWA domain-containing protein n=1 Tax=Piscinibacter sp. TaxID=1903157 RepID=UPI0025D79483|nr:VIT domain-containing protein [Piscinibacter sp.]
MRRVRGPVFPLLRHPLAPLSRTGRVVVCVLFALWAFAMSVAWSPAFADDSQAAPAEGPYFQLAGGDPAIDRLPLKSTQVDARIAGVIADVTITQRYKNEGQRPIEARYVFPGSTRAAVHAMQVRLGGRVLNAKIEEKQRARIQHETAKREGKTSALLEQERPNVFQMNVANILPGDDILVELRYTELVAPTEGRYEFVFPTVVGPRYHKPSTAGGSSSFPATPHLKEGEAPNSSFAMTVRFASPLPVGELRSPSHGIEVAGEGTPQAEVTVNDTVSHNRDFILHYRLAGERTATGLTLFQGDGPDGGGENFFLAVVEPPLAIAPAQINPREYVFVVDISGSMHGYPLNTAKVLLRNLIGHLRPTDTFNVMLFSGSSQMLNPAPVAATRANIERAITTIDQQRGGGSTEIVPALKRIAALPKASDVSRSVIVVTDGYVTVENEVFQLVRRNLGNSNVFAFGIGTSVNRHLIEGIARAGQGEPFVVTKPEMAAAQAERLRKMIDAPVLTQLKARFDGLEVYDVEPATLDALPDVLGGRPVLLYGKWRGEPRGQLVLEGQAATGTHTEVVPVRAPDADASALRHLWARSRIQQLSDQEALEGGSGQRDAITALGLHYSLLTQYTSFIAIDQIVRTSEAAVPVNRPLPLPQGVSNLAVGEVGAAVPSTPEPAAWLSLLVVLGLVGVALSRRGKW